MASLVLKRSYSEMKWLKLSAVASVLALPVMVEVNPHILHVIFPLALETVHFTPAAHWLHLYYPVIQTLTGSDRLRVHGLLSRCCSYRQCLPHWYQLQRPVRLYFQRHLPDGSPRDGVLQ